MPITAFYAGLLALIFIMLSARVIGIRRGAGISLGDGGNADLLRRIRVHGNFAEYAPFGLILMGLAESLAIPGLLLHAAGIALVAGRLSHAYAISQTPHILPLRVVGMALTLIVIGVLAAACIYGSVAR